MNSKLLTLILLLCCSVHMHGDYPLIRYTVESRDPLYSQQQEDVELWYSGDKHTVSLVIFRYNPLPSEDLFSVAAAFNLPYDALATLNSWEAPALFNAKDEVLIPNIPGIFIPKTPIGKWERMLSGNLRKGSSVSVHIAQKEGMSREFVFFPGNKFTAEERVRFLGSLFLSPVAEGRITSGFGYRPDPFTGKPSFHPGVDLSVSKGTPVLAVRDGIIYDTGRVERYGYFVIVNHDGGYQSVYAHLDAILVEKNDVVDAGDLIALSGNSGLSTGPHLHFELRRNGVPMDPTRLTSFYN